MRTHRLSHRIIQVFRDICLFDTVMFRLLLLAGIPLILTSIFALHGYRNIVIPSTLENNLTALQQENADQTSLVEAWIKEQLSKARYIGSMGCVQSWEISSMLTESRRIADSFEDIFAVVISDTEGNVVVDSIHGTGGSIRDRPFFQKAMSGGTAVTDLLVTKTSGIAVLIFATPIKFSTSNAVGGAVLVVVNPFTLYQMLEADPQDQSSRTFLVNAQGVIASGPDLGSIYVQKDRLDDTIVSSYVNHLDRRVFGASSSVADTPWTLVTESSVSNVLSRFREYNLLLTRTVLVTLMITSVMAILLALSIQRPVRQLYRYSREVTKQQRKSSVVPFPAYAPKELRTLHSTLFEMTKTIDSRTRDLEEAHNLLTHTQKIAHLGSWSITPPSTTLMCSDEISRILGLSETCDHLNISIVLRAIDREDRGGFIHEYFRSIREGDSGFEKEHRIRREDTGETRIVLQRCVHVRDTAGRLIRTIGMTHDITEQARMQRSLKKTLEEKTVLLQEVNHRVRNNLAVILGILNLQQSYLPEGASAFDALTTAHSRIAAIALVHNLLLDNDNLSSIDLRQYISGLLIHIKESQNKPTVTIVQSVESVSLDVNSAIPLGLILNELILNSYSHAFESDSGTITVNARHDPDRHIRFEVMDNGTGFNASKEHTGLGRYLINQLVNQLDGSFEYSEGPGTHAVLVF